MRVDSFFIFKEVLSKVWPDSTYPGQTEQVRRLILYVCLCIFSEVWTTRLYKSESVRELLFSVEINIEAVQCFAINMSFQYKIYRGYLLVLGEYQIYFIECVENISNFTSA